MCGWVFREMIVVVSPAELLLARCNPITISRLAIIYLIIVLNSSFLILVSYYFYTTLLAIRIIFEVNNVKRDKGFIDSLKNYALCFANVRLINLYPPTTVA